MTHRSRFLQIILILLVGIVGIRFLPIFIRLALGVLAGARLYWWILLPVMVLSLVVWKFKRRPQPRPSIRDVTNSLKGEG